jgi:molybdopterin synthase sulfur carrier subunit
MSVSVLIPTPLRKLTNEQESVTASPGTIGTILDELEGQFPGFAARLTDESGNLRKFVNVYLNEEDIRFLKGKDTEVKDGDSVSIVPAIAGGR